MDLESDKPRIRFWFSIDCLTVAKLLNLHLIVYFTSTRVPRGSQVMPGAPATVLKKYSVKWGNDAHSWAVVMTQLRNMHNNGHPMGCPLPVTCRRLISISCLCLSFSILDAKYAHGRPSFWRDLTG